MRYVGRGLWIALVVSLFVVAAQAGKAWHPLEVDVWDPPFNAERKRHTETYTPLAKASEPWRICVSIPHLKDDYWIAVNFGLIDEARRLGVALQIFEAGGYGNLEAQRRQIEECMKSGADGLIVSAISTDGVNDLVARYRAEGKPVVDLINGMSAPDLTARAAADYWDLGNRTALYIRELHADDTKPVRVAWFPGPEGAAWVDAGDKGFRAGLDGSPLEIVAAKRGDTGRSAQGALIEQVLEAHADLDYIVGTTATAEAALPILRKRDLADRIKVLAYYYGPAVHRGIARGQIVAAPTDKQGISARIAVDQIVRALEGEPLLRHVAPKVVVIDRSNVADFDASVTIPPRGFRPILSVNEW